MKKVFAIFAIAALVACGGASTEATTDSTVATVDSAAVVADTTATTGGAVPAEGSVESKEIK